MLAHSDLLIPYIQTLLVSFVTGSNKSSIQSTFLVALSFVTIFLWYLYSTATVKILNRECAIHKGDRVSAGMN